MASVRDIRITKMLVLVVVTHSKLISSDFLGFTIVSDFTSALGYEHLINVRLAVAYFFERYVFLRKITPPPSNHLNESYVM